MLRFRMLVALGLAGALAGCQDAAGPAPEQAEPHPVLPGEVAHAGGKTQIGWIYDRSGQPKEVHYKVFGTLAVTGGDIIVGEAADIPPTREALLSRAGGRRNIIRQAQSWRWPGGVVPYVINSDVPSPWRITNAMADIHQNNPAVQFVPRTTQADYIVIERYTDRADICLSRIGRVGGQQKVQLGDDCGTRSTTHELLHTLGVAHEHARCDRDMYIQVNYANIDDEYEYTFAKECGSGYIGTTYEYDEASIMHYSAYAFSINNSPTIVSLRGRSLGLYGQMTALDIAGVEYMYPSAPEFTVYIAGPTDVSSSPSCNLVYSAMVSGGVGTQTYEWKIDGSDAYGSGSTLSTSFPYPGGHQVHVMVTDAEGSQTSAALELTSSWSGMDC